MRLLLAFASPLLRPAGPTAPETFSVSKAGRGGGGGGGAMGGENPPPVLGTRAAGVPPARSVRRLSAVDVQYISIAGMPKNGRQLMAKAAKDGGRVLVEKAIRIAKSDEAKRMVYGVVYAPESVDADGDLMSAGEIEKAMRAFMKAGRVGQVDTDHDFNAGRERAPGYVAECWLTKAGDGGGVVDALFPEEPEGTWCVGIHVTCDDTWGRVENGELTGLSFYGLAKGEEEEVPASAHKGLDLDGRRTAERMAALFVEKVKSLLAGPVQAEADPEPAAVAPASGVEGLDDAPTTDAPPAGTEMVGKGFREKLLHTQLWQLTDALSSAVRDVLEDDAMTDKVGAVRAVVGEFETWLAEQVGEVVASDAMKAQPPTAQPSAAEPAGGAMTNEDLHAAVEKAVNAGIAATLHGAVAQSVEKLIAPALAPLVERVGAVEASVAKALRQTDGRQSALGGDDAANGRQKKHKGLKIL